MTGVSVTCTTDTVPTYSVGGTVSGLTGSVTLRNNGGDDLVRTADGAFTFATRLASGAAYAVTVASQPTGQTCVIASGSGTINAADVTTVAVSCSTNTYSIGGTISGLTGSVALRNNGGDELVRTTNGSFTFATPVAHGSTFAVTVASQPGGQTCVVANGSGTINAANVTTVSVSCTSDPVPTYTVGGTVTGLTGSLALANNGTDSVSVTANGPFSFPSEVPSGGTYAVTIYSQPAGQTCVITNGSGTMGSANVTSVSVSCSTNTYSVGGTLSGLSGSVTLRNNGGNDLVRTTNGSFTFSTPLTHGASYSVTVASQPVGQTCLVPNGSGTVTADVTTITVTCTSHPFLVGGSITGLVGSVTLRNNGGDDLVRTSFGPFSFPTTLSHGASYSVTIASQPVGQTCAVSNASGTINNADVTNVAVTCTTNTYSVGGTLAGLSGSITLRNDGGNDLVRSANGAFTFSTPVPHGSTYAVTVASQPVGQMCTVTNGTGTINAANVTNVAVACVTSYAVGGTISGLNFASPLVLRNNGGDDLPLESTLTFTFATKLPTGATYSVTVAQQPPGQLCGVENGTGTMGTSDVTAVRVVCGFAIGGTASGVGTGSTVRLRNRLTNGAEVRDVFLDVTTNGTFRFAAPADYLETYAVTVVTQPATQHCTLSNASGTTTAAVTTIGLTCVNLAATNHTVSANVTGLITGQSVTLRLNAGTPQTRTANGSFTFPGSLPNGSSFGVMVLTQPTAMVCAVSNAKGRIVNANASVTVTCRSRGINDSSRTTCGNATRDDLACNSTADGTHLFPGQDAERGRDAVTGLVKLGAGPGSADFTKLDPAGVDLPADAEEWACVRDNVTGLVWEVKTDDGGLHDKDWTYTWYDTNTSTNGGYPGQPNGGVCQDTTTCDTQQFVAALNAKSHCGTTGWRVPSREELVLLYPLLSPYFAHANAQYWSSTPHANSGGFMPWTVFVPSGASQTADSHSRRAVRAVRGN